MPTYTQPAGEDGLTYYEDCQITPATVKDGSLRLRTDTHIYPQTGRTVVENRGLPGVVVGASSLTPVHAVSVTLTATLTVVTKNKPILGTVTFKDGATTLGTGTASGSGGTGTASLVVAGGFTVGAHTITAIYGGKTSASITVTAS